MNLSATRMKALREPGRYSDGDGLHLFISKTGGKSWVQRMTIGGRRRDIGLGGYPAVSLSQARNRASDNREAVGNGKDPVAEKRRPAMPTFREAAYAVHEANKPRWRNGSHTLGWIQTIERHAFPKIGNKHIDTISRSDLNVDDSTTPTTLTISNARALGLEGSHTAEVRHCNAAGGCSLPLNITFMVTPSIALLGVGASLEVDASDQFSVSVRRLNPSHNYLIRVVYTTSHIAEDSGCLGGSTNTIRNFSGSTTFYLSTFNVYGCSAGTSTITANLHRVISGVEQVSSLATAVAPVSVITPNPPAAPTDLTGGVGDRGISLSWPAPSGTVTVYKVQRRVDTIGTSFSTITTLNGKDSTTHTDGDAALVEGTSYLYRVIAFNSGGG